MKAFLLLGVINSIIVVALGAFGAHALEGKVSEKALGNWETAVQYQMFHTMALFVTGLLMTKIESSGVVWAGSLFLIGIILFSGSLYVYVATGTKFLAMITPIGGITFIIGWIVLGYTLIKFL